MISFILLLTVQCCTAPTHLQYRTIPVISDDHGNLFFGDPYEQNDAAEVQSQIDELQDEVPLTADFSQELHVELPLNHISQPQTIRAPLTDEDIKLLSADLYHPVFALMRRAEAHENIANPEEWQREVSPTLSQEKMATDTGTESIDTDLGSLSAFGDLGPLSVDGIIIDPFVDTEMEILNDASQVGNALMPCVDHRLNTSDSQEYLQVQPASFDSTYQKVSNVEEQGEPNLTSPEFSDSACGHSVESVSTNSGQSLLQSGFFKYHFANQTGQKPFKCDMCQELFHSFSGFQAHQRIHTGQKTFQCDICSKQLCSFYSYQRHRRIHTGEMPFQCDLCLKRFRASSALQAHRRIHTGEKPFQCEFCPKRLRTASDHQKHRRIHTGEKPFQCDICTKQFSISSNFQKHRRIHIAEKPFQCDICTKQFHTSSGFQIHRRIHTSEKPFKCSICQKVFSDPSNFQSHRRIHADEISYVCYWCNQDYRSKQALINHVKKCFSRNVSHAADPVISVFISSDARNWTYMQ